MRGGACSTHGDNEKFVQNVSRNTSRERQPRKSGSQWEENIDMDLKEIEGEGVIYMQLTRPTDCRL
jgi:hypothetical protein